MAFNHGHALLIGVGDYKNPKLSAIVTRNDVEALATVLKNPQAAGYTPDNIAVLSGENANRSGILNGLHELAKRTDSESTVLLLLSGHGVPSHDKGYYFLPYEAQRGAGNRYNPETVIHSEELTKAIETIKYRKMLLLFNTCHSGKVAGALDDTESAEESDLQGSLAPSKETLTHLLEAGDGLFVISACRADQKSLYNPQSRHTLFTEALLNGLKGASSGLNRSGYIGLFELYDYIYNYIQKGLLQNNLHDSQEPVIFVREGVGPFAVALYRGKGKLAGLGDVEEKLAKAPQTNNPDVIHIITKNIKADNIEIKNNKSYGSGRQVIVGKIGTIYKGAITANGVTQFGSGKIGNVSYNDNHKRNNSSANDLVHQLLDQLDQTTAQLPTSTVVQQHVKADAEKAVSRLRQEVEQSLQSPAYQPDEDALETVGRRFQATNRSVMSLALTIISQKEVITAFRSVITTWKYLQ